MSAKVWVLGDAVVDLIPEEDGRLLPCPGGAPANVAVGVARLGGESGFIGRTGADPFGALMQRTLAAEGVDITTLKQDQNHRTSTVLVAHDEQGDRSFTFMVRPSADLFLVPEDLPSWQPGQWLHLCSIALSAEPSRSTAFAAMAAVSSAGGFVSFDPNIREDFWQDRAQLRSTLQRAFRLADVVKLSTDELTFFTGEQESDTSLRALAAEHQITMLLVTKGAEGVVVCYQGEVRHFPGMPVTCVDSTGAGDAFVAGLLAGLSLKGYPANDTELSELIARAQRCGALAVTARGAMTALPHQQALTLCH